MECWASWVDWTPGSGQSRSAGVFEVYLHEHDTKLVYAGTVAPKVISQMIMKSFDFIKIIAKSGNFSRACCDCVSLCQELYTALYKQSVVYGKLLLDLHHWPSSVSFMAPLPVPSRPVPARACSRPWFAQQACWSVWSAPQAPEPRPLAELSAGAAPRV